MMEILEKKLPPELAMNIFSFSRHPVADVMANIFEAHEEKMDNFRARQQDRYRQKQKAPPSESWARHHFIQNGHTKELDAEGRKRFRQIYY